MLGWHQNSAVPSTPGQSLTSVKVSKAAEVKREAYGSPKEGGERLTNIHAMPGLVGTSRSLGLPEGRGRTAGGPLGEGLLVWGVQMGPGDLR